MLIMQSPEEIGDTIYAHQLIVSSSHLRAVLITKKPAFPPPPPPPSKPSLTNHIKMFRNRICELCVLLPYKKVLSCSYRPLLERTACLDLSSSITSSITIQSAIHPIRQSACLPFLPGHVRQVAPFHLIECLP